MEMEGHHLYRPLLTPAASSGHDDGDGDLVTSSDTAIMFRLLSVILIGAISVWANHEASKGFQVSVINELANQDSPAGNRFELFYVSNDKATRILLNTSSFVEQILYPPHADGSISTAKKLVPRVTLRLVADDANTTLTRCDDNGDGFVIEMGSSVVMTGDAAVISALQRGMARIWLWDGESEAPASLVDGLAEYVAMKAGFGEEKESVGLGGGELPESVGHVCWDSREPRVTARFLDFCEGQSKGFIQRLNQGLRKRWQNQTVDDALGRNVGAKHLCDSYHNVSFSFSFLI